MQIRFDGPPGHVSGRFVEVEDERGRSIRVGRWAREGTDWLLIIPEDQNLREAVKQVLVELDGFLSIEQQGLDWEGVILPRLADRLRFALNPSAPLVMRRGLTTWPKGMRMSGTIGEKLDQIIAEASAFSEFDVGTDDAFRLIVKLAHDIDNLSHLRTAQSDSE